MTTTTLYRCPTCQARAPLSQFQSISDAYYYCRNCKNVIVPIPDSSMRHSSIPYHEAQWRVDKDEESGAHFWRGGGSGDKDETRFNVGSNLIMDPASFQVGTIVNITEPAAT